MVFLATVVEIDLSFPAVMALGAWIFALCAHAGIDPFISLFAGLAVAVMTGAANGMMVVYGGLSALVATLGMSFLIRGAILIATGGKSIVMLSLKDTVAYQMPSGTLYGSPAQMFSTALFVVTSVLL